MKIAELNGNTAPAASVEPEFAYLSQHNPLEATMSSIEHMSEKRASVCNDLSAIFVSLELSRSTWLITSLSPGGGEKMSKHQVRGGDSGCTSSPRGGSLRASC